MLRLLIFLLLLPFLGDFGTVDALKAAAPQKRIALTFDDVPRDRGAFLTHEERTVKLIAALERAGVEQAAFFVTAGFLQDADRRGGEDRITAYAAAGHVLANHSYTHPRLSKVSAAEYLADLDHTEAWLKGREGRRPWFRHPYLDEGMGDKAKRDAIRAGLKTRGLRNGYVTIDGGDWHIEQLTQEAARAGKTMDIAALRDFYVQTHVEAVRFGEALARRELRRSPIHVLLLHETDIAALFIADLVAALRRDGWEIVTADKAFADPLRRAMPDPAITNGTVIGQMARARGSTEPTYPAVAETDTQRRVFRERVLKENPAQ